MTITRDAARFTDSRQALLYRLPLSNGRPAGQPVELPLDGEWGQVPGAFNANGIDATLAGRSLLVVNGTVGAVFQVDPATGVASRIETSAVLTAGDGILLRGRQLSVVRNRFNEIAVLRLAPDLGSATLVDTLTDPDFAVPTTIALFGNTLHAVNARFNLPPGPYRIVKVDGGS